MALLAVSLVARAEEPLKILSYNLRFGELATVEQDKDALCAYAGRLGESGQTLYEYLSLLLMKEMMLLLQQLHSSLNRDN